MKKFKLGKEINLLDQYPRSKRPIEQRAKSVTINDRLIARQFGKEYFDGTRNQGYGGYKYNPKFWQAVVKKIAKYYKLNSKSKILDVGCGKGFMLHDFKHIIPGITITGIDISEYAVSNSMEDVKPYLIVGNAKNLPYSDSTFDLVLSINTIHNLPLEECFKALKEIERVSKKDKYIINDGFRTEEEKALILKWNLTALTFLSTKDWQKLYELAGFTGDYYWFIPK